MNILVMDLENIEARNDCTGVDQQQFNQPTDWLEERGSGPWSGGYGQSSTVWNRRLGSAVLEP
jgi:hypothetical protein